MEPRRLFPSLSTRGLGPILGLSIAAMFVSTILAVGAIAAGGHGTVRVDACALPAGIDFGVLGAADRSYALRRGLLCADLENHRITLAAFDERVRALEVAPSVPVSVALPTMTWA